MKKLLGILLVFACLNSIGQSVEGLWYNEKFDYFIQLDGKRCTFTNKWYRGTDTIGYFRNDHYNKYRHTTDELKFKDSSHGQLIVGRRDKCRYRIVKHTDSMIILEPDLGNAKNKSGVLEYTDDGQQIILRREEPEFYFFHTGFEL